MEALIEELNMTEEHQAALQAFVRERRFERLAELAEREEVVSWITCIHLFISYKELRRVADNGARPMLVRTASSARIYPALVSARWNQEQDLLIYSAPNINMPDAGIAYLGYAEGDVHCHLVGSLRGYLAHPLTQRTEPRILALNAWDFWAKNDNGVSHSKIVQMLLDKGADVNAQGEEYGNALQAASSREHENIEYPSPFATDSEDEDVEGSGGQENKGFSDNMPHLVATSRFF